MPRDAGADRGRTGLVADPVTVQPADLCGRRGAALFNGDVFAATTLTGLAAAAGVGALGPAAGVRAMRRGA
jgi:hypothetical protein